jgi:hypothetical protein
LALLAVMLAVAPWGNYPLNDDWQYALAARHYARTNLIRIDTAIAPSLVGQLVMAWPFMKVFGFSHRLLRLLTLAMAFFVLWVCDALLTEWEVPRRVRLRVLLVLALNPLFVNLATSFMTEFYGYAPALAGALIWQRGRRHAQADGASPVIRWGAAAWAGALVGVTFWTRQYCIVVYPALVGATAGRLALARDWRRLALSWWPMLAGTVAFAATIGGYIVWAKHYGWLKPAFLGPLEHVLDVDPVSLNLGAGVQLVYLSVYLLPLLVSWPVSRHDWQRAIRPCLVTLGFGITIYSLIQLAAPSDAGALGIHRVFPFNSNLIHTRGLGPVTLTDEFYLGADPYLIRSRAFWRGVTYVVIGASILWGLPVATAGAWRGTSTSRLEGLAFSAAFVGLSLAAHPASLWTRRLRSLRLSAGDRRGVPAGDLARAQRGSVGRAAAAQPARERAVRDRAGADRVLHRRRRARLLPLERRALEPRRTRAQAGSAQHQHRRRIRGQRLALVRADLQAPRIHRDQRLHRNLPVRSPLRDRLALELLRRQLSRRHRAARRVPGDRAHPAALLVRGGPAVDPLEAAEVSA